MSLETCQPPSSSYSGGRGTVTPRGQTPSLPRPGRGRAALPSANPLAVKGIVSRSAPPGLESKHALLESPSASSAFLTAEPNRHGTGLTAAPPRPRVALETLPPRGRPLPLPQRAARSCGPGPRHAARPRLGEGGGGCPSRALQLLQPTPRPVRPPEVPSAAGRGRAVSAGVRRAAPCSPAACAPRAGTAAPSALRSSLSPFFLPRGGESFGRTCTSDLTKAFWPVEALTY